MYWYVADVQNTKLTSYNKKKQEKIVTEVTFSVEKNIAFFQYISFCHDM